MKKYKSLISMCAFAALTNCAKADIESVQEHQGTGRIVVHDPDAEIGRGNELFKWMIVSPDGGKAFANDFTTNAISVVTEDGTNYYAHVQGENNDRTKVIHFTVDKNGFPSSYGDVIDTTLSGEEDNQEKMKNRRLVGVRNGSLLFSSDNGEGTYLNYRIQTGEAVFGEEQEKCLAICQDDSNFYVLVRRYNVENPLSSPTVLEYYDKKMTDRFYKNRPPRPNNRSWWDPKEYDWNTPNGNEYEYKAITCIDTNRFAGISNGMIWDCTNVIPQEKAPLPGPISGLSNNGEEVFATTESTNAFYNVTLNGYNVVKDENGQPKSMIPPTTRGLLRVIDNRKKGGKFLYVTRKGIHAIE